MNNTPKIIYTRTDEAPALATHSLLPVIETFTASAGIGVETRDISLAARILAQFPDFLPEDQRVSDDLTELGELAKTPEANIIKLPNISASMPQLHAAIRELQEQGVKVPDYPVERSTEEERDIQTRYDKVKGSAVNPVLREGNSDRRAPRAVKEYARKHPHSMGEWSPESKTRVATMGRDDFRSNEKSLVSDTPRTVRVEWHGEDGKRRVLKEGIPLQEGEVLDGTVMRKKSLVRFLREQKAEAKREGVLLSLHLKATMMKVSDPIIFRHAVRVYFEEVVSKHEAALREAGVDFTHGLGDLEAKLDQLPAEVREEVKAGIEAALEAGPDLAMVNSDKGITNLHVPSDVIIDASMPAMIRQGGRMWDKDGGTRDTLAVIPDSSYAGVYQTVIDFCKENGALDPRTMGSVPNVGLMAQKAEEYGSHDKTFEISAAGVVRVVDEEGGALMEHSVGEGDIWRACQTKDPAIRDWVKLAVNRARETGSPAVFWLDESRAHDAVLIDKVRRYLKDHDTEGLDIRILSPADACRFSLERILRGEDTISVTGNVLRDYLTDLFPILEVGTSAKMLSIVPLMNGGGLFETGAGGSAPKHVQQFVEQNYLRWDSLGEFLALAVSLEHAAKVFDLPEAAVLGETLDRAVGRLLENNKSPTRKLGGIDNRGSHFYLALYWARELATHADREDLRTRFTPLADALEAAEERINEEMIGVQGRAVDIGGYYRPDAAKAVAAMRPSQTFNELMDGFGAG